LSAFRTLSQQFNATFGCHAFEFGRYMRWRRTGQRGWLASEWYSTPKSGEHGFVLQTWPVQDDHLCHGRAWVPETVDRAIGDLDHCAWSYASSFAVDLEIVDSAHHTKGLVVTRMSVWRRTSAGSRAACADKSRRSIRWTRPKSDYIPKKLKARRVCHVNLLDRIEPI
jgi:hypothetical protein